MRREQDRHAGLATDVLVTTDWQAARVNRSQGVTMGGWNIVNGKGKVIVLSDGTPLNFRTREQATTELRYQRNRQVQTSSDVKVLRGDNPWLPGHAFIRRPGLAEQVARLVEKYDEEHKQHL